MGTYAQLEGMKVDDSLTKSEFDDVGRIHKEFLGREIVQDGKKYVFARINQDVDVSAGDALVMEATSTAPTVTGDTTGSSNGIAGATFGASVAAHSPSTDTEDYYGYVQVEGKVTGLTDASNGVAAGDYIVADTSNDNNWKSFSAGDEHEAAGIAMTAASGGSFDAYLFR